MSPPSGWFHQHFNIGKEAARQLALRFGSRLHPIGLHQAAKKKTDGVYISVKNGGTMIEYEDEDVEIRRRFEANLKRWEHRSEWNRECESRKQIGISQPTQRRNEKRSMKFKTEKIRNRAGNSNDAGWMTERHDWISS